MWAAWLYVLVQFGMPEHYIELPWGFRVSLSKSLLHIFLVIWGFFAHSKLFFPFFFLIKLIKYDPNNNVTCYSLTLICIHLFHSVCLCVCVTADVDISNKYQEISHSAWHFFPSYTSPKTEVQVNSHRLTNALFLKKVGCLQETIFFWKVQMWVALG